MKFQAHDLSKLQIKKKYRTRGLKESVVEITGVLCNFRLVLKRQTVSEMPGSKSFRPATLPYQMQKTTPQDHRRGIAVTFVESTIRDLPEVARAKFLGLVRLLR